MNMSWKTDHRSLYYMGAPAPDDPVIVPRETALLVIDIQNTYLERPDRAKLAKAEQLRFDAWTPFHERMHNQVIPRTGELLKLCRANGIECLFARIASHTTDGRERSLSQTGTLVSAELTRTTNSSRPREHTPSTQTFKPVQSS